MTYFIHSQSVLLCHDDIIALLIWANKAPNFGLIMNHVIVSEDHTEMGTCRSGSHSEEKTHAPDRIQARLATPTKPVLWFHAGFGEHGDESQEMWGSSGSRAFINKFNETHEASAKAI